jgi:hypothetical protein
MKKHGMRYHKFYSTWDSMMQRCNNPKCTNYKNYGARGIIVSEEFKNCKTFIEYLESLPDYSKDKTMDRINNEGNYERGNLKWSTTVEQNLNKRIKSDNTSGYTGVAKAVNSPRWRAYIYLNSKKQISIGIYDTIKEAVEARNDYIISNKLNHKIQKYV